MLRACLIPVFVIAVALSGATACSSETAGGSNSSSSSSGAAQGAPVCPGGGPTGSTVVQCTGDNPTNEACSSADVAYCVVYGCPPPACNIFDKVLHACCNDKWSSGGRIEPCKAASAQELDAYDGSPCDMDPPCDITVGDGDQRVAVCSNGTWHVFGE